MLPRTTSAAAIALLLVVDLVAAPTARASPRSAPLEERVADGDAEDVAVGRDPAEGLRFATVSHATPRSAPGGSAWVSLVGFGSGGTERPQAFGGAVVVGLPFDRLARAPARTAGFAPATAPGEALPIAFARYEAPAAPAPLPSSFARACVSAAWRAASLGASDARIDAIVSRARWSGLLPEARVRAVRGEDQRASLDAGVDVSRLRGSAGADLTLEARLTWRLDRLLFADDEPSLERLRLERHDARLRVAARTLEALFHWQRARRELATGGGDGALDAESRLAESEATLDVLTDGWFSDVRRGRREPAETAPRGGGT